MYFDQQTHGWKQWKSWKYYLFGMRTRGSCKAHKPKWGKKLWFSNAHAFAGQHTQHLFLQLKAVLETVFIFMLTLESRCIPVVLGGVRIQYLHHINIKFENYNFIPVVYNYIQSWEVKHIIGIPIQVQNFEFHYSQRWICKKITFAHACSNQPL